VSDWPTFVEGQIYLYGEIAQYVFFERRDRRHVDADTRFIYSRGDEGTGYFDEVVEESPFSLVSAQEALEDIAALRRRGLTTQDIARAAGISLDSAHRAAAGLE
jgi:hypothetical protein